MEIGVVDALAVVLVVADKGAQAGLGKYNLLCSGDVRDSSAGENALQGVSFVKRADCVFDSAFSVFGIRVYAACVAVTDEGYMAARVWHFRTHELVVEAGSPGLEGKEPRR